MGGEQASGRRCVIAVLLVAACLVPFACGAPPAPAPRPPRPTAGEERLALEAEMLVDGSMPVSGDSPRLVSAPAAATPVACAQPAGGPACRRGLRTRSVDQLLQRKAPWSRRATVRGRLVTMLSCTLDACFDLDEDGKHVPVECPNACLPYYVLRSPSGRVLSTGESGSEDSAGIVVESACRLDPLGLRW
jgi:hypothetical protein